MESTAGGRGRELARYGKAIKDRAVARLLPPESAAVKVVSREIGASTSTLERWRSETQFEIQGKIPAGMVASFLKLGYPQHFFCVQSCGLQRHSTNARFRHGTCQKRGNMSQSPELLRRLLRAKDRMDGASHEKWPVHRLAQVSSVSESHFAHSFRNAFGIPPHRYLLARRIERAAALLRNSDQSITEIAFQTGWKSLGTFGRIFRDITGETPGNLRARERLSPYGRECVPECIARAAHRPDLRIAVSEKRRKITVERMQPQSKEALL